MNAPTLPPYLGSWDELVKALLNQPFLGSGQGRIPPRLGAEMFREGGPEMGPQPDPWFFSTATSLFTSLIAMKQVASHLGGESRGFERAADQALEDLLDDFCGTPPHIPPSPWPFAIGVELIAFARALPEGELRNTIIIVGGKVIQRSVGVAAPEEVGVGA
jgi:hypothetical protein